MIVRFGVAALGIALATGAAHAQRPTTSSPANAVPQGSPLPYVLPSAPPTVSSPLPPLPPATPTGPAPAADVAIRGVRIEGVTAYPEPRVAALASGLTGPAVPLAKIDEARLAILNLYRGDGYVLTTVSASIGANGQLRFLVTEGRIADVKLEGDIGPAGTQVLRFLDHLTQVRPIDTATLERWSAARAGRARRGRTGRVAPICGTIRAR